MDDSPLSQSSDRIPRIFCKPDGSQWRVFVEAGGIIARPKLIRTLKAAGAHVCTDPRQADVILVDSTSDQGKLFIRDWSKDVNKVVLEYGWAKASISASRVLGIEEEWGGYIAVDDGQRISQETDDIHKSPLPTPRITPVEVTQGLPKPTMLGSPPLQHAHLPFNDPPPTQGDFAYPPESTIPFQMQQFPPHIVAAYMSQMMQAFSQSNMLAQSPYSNQPGPSNLPFIPFASHPMVPWGTHNGQPFNPSFYPHNMSIPTLNQYSTDPHMSISTQNLHNPPHTDSSDTFGLSRSPSTIPPSLRRKSPIQSRATASSYISGDIIRSASPLSSTPISSQSVSQPASGSVPSLFSTLFRSKKGQELSFFVQVDLNDRSKVVTAIKKNGGKITNSHVTADYVILYSRSKTFTHLLQSAFAAGRPVINAKFVYDSIQRHKLLDTLSYEFEPPQTTTRGKRKREHSEGDDPLEDIAERKRLDKNRREKQRRQQSKLKAKISPAKLPESPPKDSFQHTTRGASPQSSSLSDAHLQHQSPTPPPEHARIRRGSGDGYMYSDTEKDYCRRYIRILFERDHRMSVNAVAQALHHKMHHHTLASWRSFLKGASFGVEYDLMQKRASIAYRKREANMSKEEEGPKRSEPSSEDNHLASQPLDEIGKKQQVIQELERLAQFFAKEGSDEEEEDEKMWARLTKQVQCQTARSWEEFYDEHYEEVKKRYEELVVS